MSSIVRSYDTAGSIIPCITCYFNQSWPPLFKFNYHGIIGPRYTTWGSRWQMSFSFSSGPFSGADPGFQVRGGALKKNAPSRGRRENFLGISCEKSRFYAKKSYFSNFRGGGAKFLGYFMWKITIYPPLLLVVYIYVSSRFVAKIHINHLKFQAGVFYIIEKKNCVLVNCARRFGLWSQMELFFFVIFHYICYHYLQYGII